MGTAILDLKLAQDISIIDQDPLFLVFLDLWKAYDTVERDRLIITLEGYVAGPRMCGILEKFWECQQVVLSHKGFHRPAFPATRGTTQGGLVSSTMFNVVVDNIIRTWLSMTVEYQSMDHNRLVETIGCCVVVFYANNDMVGSRNSYWLQHEMNVLVGLFRRYGLAANVANSCTMACQPVALRERMSEDAMALKCTGWETCTK